MVLQQNNSLFIIDSDENFNNIHSQTTAKSSIEMDLASIDTKRKTSYSCFNSDEGYTDLDNHGAENLPIDMGLSPIDKTPTGLAVLTSVHPSKGLSMIDSENFNIDIERNKKRQLDSDEDSGILNCRKPTNGLDVIDSENWDDSSNDNVVTTQAKKKCSVGDSDDFKTSEKRNCFNETDEISFNTNCDVSFDNNTVGTPKKLTTTIMDSTDEQKSTESNDLISDSEQSNEESESEEEENAPSGSSLKETDESEKMHFLLSHFTDEQYDRYEKYKRSAFPKTKIKKVIESIVGHSVSKNVVIAMAGIAKSFVGDIIETSLDVQDEQGGNKGPLHPRHIREAVRQLRRQGKISRSRGNFRSQIEENLDQ